MLKYNQLFVAYCAKISIIDMAILFNRDENYIKYRLKVAGLPTKKLKRTSQLKTINMSKPLPNSTEYKRIINAYCLNLSIPEMAEALGFTQKFIIDFLNEYRLPVHCRNESVKKLRTPKEKRIKTLKTIKTESEFSVAITKTNIDNLKKKVVQKNNQIVDLKLEITDLKSANDTLTQTNKILKRSNVELRKINDELKIELPIDTETNVELYKKIEKLIAQNEKLTEKLKDAKRESVLSDRKLEQAYKNGINDALTIGIDIFE